ncbi:MAG TPA: SUMF1/EgtB/PvdO family nonheme iron enzyme [Planctomycetota bacterium]|nr:SUMF1/EgtB/PvdO family nonheme iron enzyme [Planctomycetota bacterium]
MAHDVFISHSAKDKGVAGQLCAGLEARDIRCWIAPRDIVPGMPWGEALEDAIAASRVLLLVYSAHANASPQVLREVERAASQGIPILPLRIEDVLPCKSLRFFISSHHWMDALSGRVEGDLDRLADGILKLLAEPLPTEAAPAPAPRAPQAVPGRDGDRLPPGWTAQRQAVRVATPEGDFEKEIAFYANTIGMKFVLVPGGEFPRKVRVLHPTKGSLTREKPPVRVASTKPFYLSAYPVTVGEFGRFVQVTSYVTDSEAGEGASIHLSGREWVARKDISWRTPGFAQTDSHPVTCVTWLDAAVFAEWLAGLEGLPYRMPTSAEWEFACRAGTTSPFYWGDEFRPDCAWAGSNSSRKTHPVGTRLPNKLGLYDMSGNVWEWCQDWALGKPSGEKKILRGASWWNAPNNCQSSNLWPGDPSWANWIFGFRVLVTLGA